MNTLGYIIIFSSAYYLERTTLQTQAPFLPLACRTIRRLSSISRALPSPCFRRRVVPLKAPVAKGSASFVGSNILQLVVLASAIGLFIVSGICLN